MTALDRPVITVECEHALGVGAVGGVAGDAVGPFPRFFAGFLNDHMAFDNKRLADAGEVEILVELGCRPDGTRLDAAMSQRRGFAEVRLAALGKSHREIVEQLGLIAFDRKQVMRLTGEYVAGQVALGQ